MNFMMKKNQILIIKKFNFKKTRAKIKLATIVGTRPEIIRLSSIINI